MKNQLQFKISAALKSIIGRDLINDDFIAVFELVKNAYDAHASHVEIIFEKTKDTFTKITIMDNGKGMNYDDLINKWLFVAY
jgi:DNA mismatch repair ATPase MutL